MNNLEETIKNNLTNEQVLIQIENLQKTFPRYKYGIHGISVSIETSIEQFNYSKDILLQTIENGDFGKLPISLQSQMNEYIRSIINDPENIDKFIDYQQKLYHSVFTLSLEYRLRSVSGFRHTLSNIGKLKPKYDDAKKSIDTITAKAESIEKAHHDANKCLEHISTVNQKVKEYQEGTESSLNKIKLNEQEIENRKKEILAFHNNITNYQSAIDKKTADAQTIIDEFDKQRTTVDNLIASAEEALQLKTAEGISAALSAQYDESKSKKTTGWWIFAAVLFVVVALTWVVWLALSETNSINSIISRIVGIAITISGATFCAKQYTRQKDIAENYAYKTVLAKSIVAFTEKIKEYDLEKSVTFLEGAIQEINRSPAHEVKRKSYYEKSNRAIF